jgi:hypothetical protein
MHGNREYRLVRDWRTWNGTASFGVAARSSSWLFEYRSIAPPSCLGIGARYTFGGQLMGVVCCRQAGLSDRSSITPFRRVQSCFPTYLQVLSIQPFGPQTLPLSFLLYVERDSLSPFLKCQPNLIKSSSPSSHLVTHWLRPVIVTLHPPLIDSDGFLI